MKYRLFTTTFRILAGTAALALVLMLAGCGGKKDGGGGSAGAGGEAASAVDEAASVIDEAASAIAAAAPASDFTYDLNEDGKSIVINKYTGDGGALVIPAEIEGYPVTRLAEAAFYSEVSGYPQYDPVGPGYFLTSVVIPASVKVIGDYCFSEIENLTSVTILGTDVELQLGAFVACENLSELIVPEGGKVLKPGKYGEEAFYGCKKLPLAVRAKLKEWGFEI
ncbi:MAG: leucine-rich repeat domain-containing protein [Treponema sp.]|jgi:hypothetical protein|nr:leucine-rich repeat domain-containing protein [Treponema sp.]